jgi:hypothetical protein
MMRTWSSLLLINLLTGCAVVAEYPVTSASVAIMAATGKGPADHALSHVAGQDCATLRVIENERICQKYTMAEVVDLTTSKSTAKIKTYPTTMVATAEDVFAQRAKKR